MLTLRERYRVLRILQFYSKLNLFPTQVDMQAWTVVHAKYGKTWKGIASMLSFPMMVLGVVYKSLSLLYSLVFLGDTPFHQLMIHVVVASAQWLVVFWFYNLQIKYPAEYGRYMKMTLTGNVSEDIVPELPVKDEERWIHRLKRCSLQDLIALFLPYMFAVGILSVWSICVYDPTIKLLVYGALPETYRNWPTLGLCLLEKLRIWLVCLGVVGTTWQVQVISFDLVNQQLNMILQALMESRDRRVVRIQQNYNALRCLQLYMQFLNIVNQDMIFACKFIVLGVNIISGYAAIAHFIDHPVYGITYVVCFVNSTSFYTLVYDKAFEMPDSFRKVKAIFRLNLNRHMNGSLRKIMERRILSIPILGIQVGTFHLMERASTAVYLHYVLSNVASMLLAYA